MPGFDRRGPLGAGSMSGKGRGNCNPVNKGFTFQSGRGRGYGRGQGFRNGFMGYAPPETDGRDDYNWYHVQPEDKTGVIDMLKAEAVSMKHAIETIEKRIEGLEKKDSPLSE